MNSYPNPGPVQFPDLTDFKRHPTDVDTYPIYYTYKTMPATSTVSICSILRKYLLRRLTYRDAEAGGILGLSDGIVTHYYHDRCTRSDAEHFLPSSEDLNWILRQWNKVGIEFGGVLHCHPSDRIIPSESDLRFVEGLLTFNPQLPSVVMGIVTGDIHFYQFDRDFLNYRKEMQCGE